MAYMLVMGSVLLSVVVCLGWASWALGRWCWMRLSPPQASPRKASSRKTPTPKPRQSAARKKQTTSRADTVSRSSRRKEPSEPAPPGGLTRLLASCRAALPLGLLILFLYGGARLAEVGMQSSQKAVPESYHQAVWVLGWAALGILLLAALALLATWRIARFESRQ